MALTPTGRGPQAHDCHGQGVRCRYAECGRHEDTQAGVPEQAEDDNEEDDLEGAAEEGGESETPAGDEVETDEVIDKSAKRPRTVAGFEPNDYNSLSNKLR